MTKIKSTFAILDVKSGRKSLARRIANGERVPVVIHGWIDLQHSQDDGESIEFSVDVSGVHIPEVAK